jgi:hypothetical protein
MKTKILETKLAFLIRDAPDIRPDNPAFFISGTGIRPDNRLPCRISGKAG